MRVCVLQLLPTLMNKDAENASQVQQLQLGVGHYPVRTF